MNEERPPLMTYVWAGGWLLGIGWIAINTHADTALMWLIIVGVLAALWLGVWSAIFGVVALFLGAVGLFVKR